VIKVNWAQQVVEDVTMIFAKLKAPEIDDFP
jgi:hypothetical protein